MLLAHGGLRHCWTVCHTYGEFSGQGVSVPEVKQILPFGWGAQALYVGLETGEAGCVCNSVVQIGLSYTRP